MQKDKSCSIVEQYMAYLITIKGRSQNTVLEYRLDLLRFFEYVDDSRGGNHPDFRFADIDFIHSISLGEMYGFLAYCQNILQSSPVREQEKLFPYDSSGSISKPKPILLITILLKNWKR